MDNAAPVIAEPLPATRWPMAVGAASPREGALLVDFAAVKLEPPPLGLVATATLEPSGVSRVSQVLAIRVRVEVKGSVGAHQLFAEFGAPGDVTYERKSASIEGDGFTPRTIDFVLPVAGTMIDAQQLSGTWTVRIFHDGQPLAAPTFELTR